MGTHAVVIQPPLLNLQSSVGEVGEPTHVQAFVTETPVETLDVRILNGFTRLDCRCADSFFQGPGQKPPTAEFRAFVRPSLEAVRVVEQFGPAHG